MVWVPSGFLVDYAEIWTSVRNDVVRYSKRAVDALAQERT